MTWDERAACKDLDQAIFFPETVDGGQGYASYRAARLVCARCPVPRECLDEAMHDERTAGRAYRFGMRGGLSPLERARLARSRDWVAA